MTTTDKKSAPATATLRTSAAPSKAAKPPTPTREPVQFRYLLAQWVCERRTDGCKLSLPRDDAEHDPTDRRAELDGRLLGLDLDDWLVLVDRLTLRDEPARDLALLEALTEIGQRECVRHEWAA